MRPGIIFYLFYVAGVPVNALIGETILGAMAYGTYEYTNYATLRDGSLQVVAVDLTWGAVLTGFSTWLRVTLTRAFT